MTTPKRDKADGPIRHVTMINLALVAIQPVSAGFLMSGFDYAATVHTVVASALQIGALIQSVTAIVLWRRRRVSSRVAAFGVGLFAMVFLQVGLGFNREYWLHVPIGVGLVGWLTRQVSSAPG